MPAINDAQLKKDLAQESFKSLYVFYGAEKHVLKRAAKRLMKKAVDNQFPDFNFHEFTNDTPVDQIADAAEALPMMALRKCVTVSDYNVEEKNAVEAGKLYELMENPPPSTVLVFYYPTLEFDGKKAAKWKKLLKAAEQTGYSIEYPLRTPAELNKILIHDAEKAGCALSRQNAARIIDYAGTDLKTLLSENAKLCAFADGGEITLEMVESMVVKTTETTAFILAASLVAGDYEKAYACIDQLFYQREEPVMILSALSASYVDLYRVKAALQSGKPAAAPAQYGEYKGREFRLSKAERSLRGISLAALRKSIAILLETDVALKSSKVGARILLDAMVAKLLLAAKGESGG